MVIQAGAGRLGAPDGAARFAGIRDSGREALAELERLVELLSTEDPRPRDLETLLRQARAAGVRLDYTPLPDGVRVTPELQDGAYRVVQEGLTNAIKHAAGSDVLVRLGLHASALEVEVRDRGSAVPSPLAASGAGLGLAGMRERVEALGGVLEAGPLEAGGWRLRARLPLG
jgi:signal transduction histidine kinase